MQVDEEIGLELIAIQRPPTEEEPGEFVVETNASVESESIDEFVRTIDRLR